MTFTESTTIVKPNLILQAQHIDKFPSEEMVNFQHPDITIQVHNMYMYYNMYVHILGGMKITHLFRSISFIIPGKHAYCHRDLKPLSH